MLSPVMKVAIESGQWSIFISTKISFLPFPMSMLSPVFTTWKSQPRFPYWPSMLFTALAVQYIGVSGISSMMAVSDPEWSHSPWLATMKSMSLRSISFFRFSTKSNLCGSHTVSTRTVFSSWIRYAF